MSKQQEQEKLLKEHRDFFEGVIKHAPHESPKESLDIYRQLIAGIDEVLNNE